MEIRVLRNFLVLAERKTVSDAAKELYMTQPNLSRQLADLEKELGCVLFERNGKRLAITNEGRYLKRQARKIVALADETTTTLATFDEAEHGTVAIAESFPLGSTTVSEAVGVFARQCPDVFFKSMSVGALDIPDLLDRRGADFGVMFDSTPSGTLNRIPLPDESPWGVLTHKDSRLAMLDCVRPTDIAAKSLMVPADALAGTWFSSWLADADIHSRTIGSYDLPNLPLPLVENGTCDVMAPAKLAARLAADGPLCFRPLAPRLTSRLLLVWGDESGMSPSARLFLSVVRATLEDRLHL